jgi:hypothetical protein
MQTRRPIVSTRSSGLWVNFNRFLTLKLKLRVESGLESPPSPDPGGLECRVELPASLRRECGGGAAATMKGDELLAELIQRLPNSGHSFW